MKNSHIFIGFSLSAIIGALFSWGTAYLFFQHNGYTLVKYIEPTKVGVSEEMAYTEPMNETENVTTPVDSKEKIKVIVTPKETKVLSDEENRELELLKKSYGTLKFHLVDSVKAPDQSTYEYFYYSSFTISKVTPDVYQMFKEYIDGIKKIDQKTPTTPQQELRLEKQELTLAFKNKLQIKMSEIQTRIEELE